MSKPVLAASLAISCASYEVIWPACACVKVWQRLQRIECLAEQISAAQAGKGPEQESSLPLNALNHAADRAARTGTPTLVSLQDAICTHHV